MSKGTWYPTAREPKKVHDREVEIGLRFASLVNQLPYQLQKVITDYVEVKFEKKTDDELNREAWELQEHFHSFAEPAGSSLDRPSELFIRALRRLPWLEA